MYGLVWYKDAAHESRVSVLLAVQLNWCGALNAQQKEWLTPEDCLEEEYSPGEVDI